MRLPRGCHCVRVRQDIERHDGEAFKPCHRDGSFIDMDQFELPFVYRNESIAKDNLKVIEKSVAK